MKSKFRTMLLYVFMTLFFVAGSSFHLAQADQNEPIILPEYEALYGENNDLFGWITIEGANIDFPVMHTPDNPIFYLKKDWNKKDSKLGCIFLDGRCGKDSGNLIIYGHHFRKSDSMFGSLINYKDESFYEQHKYIEFDTLYEKATYEIISVAKAVVYYQRAPKGEYLFYEHTEFYSANEFEDYMNYLKDNAYYEIDTHAEYGDQLLTLTTCDYWTDNARLLVVAKKL